MNTKVIVAADRLPAETKIRIDHSDVLCTAVIDGQTVLALNRNSETIVAMTLPQSTIGANTRPLYFDRPKRCPVHVFQQKLEDKDPAIYVDTILWDVLSELQNDRLMGNGPAEEPILLLATSITRNGSTKHIKVIYSDEDNTARVLAYSGTSPKGWWETSCWQTMPQKTALEALQAAADPVRVLSRPM